MKLFELANLAALATDGPYPEYDCRSGSHEHHKDSSDSIYQQTIFQGKFFSELLKQNIFGLWFDIFKM